jgi:VanZ family protein
MPRRHHLSLQLLLLYAAFIIYATTIPFAFEAPPESLPEKFRALLADPLQLRASRGLSSTDILSNVLLFLPFGFFFALAHCDSSRFRQRGGAVVFAACAGLVLSVLAEFVQFFSERRVASLLDCFGNGAGAILGAGFALHYQKRHRAYWERYWRNRFAQSPELGLFCAYAALLALAQLLPLELTLDISTLKKTLKATEWSLPQTATALGGLLAETILYAGLAFLWLHAQPHAQRTRTIVQAVFLAAGAALVIEGAQLFLVAHVIKLRNVLAGLEGGLYGAAWHIIIRNHLAPQVQPKRALLTLALGHLLAYIFLLELRPYQFDFSAARLAAKLAQFQWLPFIEYYRNTNTHAVLDLCESLVRFAVFAVLVLARTGLDKKADTSNERVLVLGLALGLSILVEALRLGLPKRAPGVTDCVNAVLGAGLGIWLWQKFRSIPSPPRIIKSKERRSRP